MVHLKFKTPLGPRDNYDLFSFKEETCVLLWEVQKQICDMM